MLKTHMSYPAHFTTNDGDTAIILTPHNNLFVGVVELHNGMTAMATSWNHKGEALDGNGFANYARSLVDPTVTKTESWEKLDSHLKELCCLIQAGGVSECKKITAIKQIRHATGCSLAEAKYWYEDLIPMRMHEVFKSY